MRLLHIFEIGYGEVHLRLMLTWINIKIRFMPLVENTTLDVLQMKFLILEDLFH